jgi:hypothetical protein
MEHGEIVVYKTTLDAGLQLEVKIEDETVWLTQAQMVELFCGTKQNISLHINNIFKEGELKAKSVVKDSLTTARDGKSYKTKFYNLDVIISVGYRVKSHRGTQFRIWANKILKEYLLRGHVYNYRFEKIERKLVEHDQKFELIINTGLKPTEGIFYDGQIFDAWEFVSGLIKEAKQSIILIDNYIDESVLALLAKRQAGVKASIYTASITKQLKHDLARHNKQYPAIQAHAFNKAHDRFLIIDDETVYHIGASLKDLGKKWFAFSRIDLDAKEMLEKLSEL